MEQKERQTRLEGLRKSLLSKIKMPLHMKLESNQNLHKDAEVLKSYKDLKQVYHTGLIAKDSYFNPEVSRNKNRTMKGNIHYGFPNENFSGYTKPKTFFN